MKSAASQGSEKPAELYKSKNPPKVLLIDDEESVLFIVRKMLEVEGLSVEVCSSGQDALTRLPQIHYDIILCDMWMPGMTGKDFYYRVQEEFPEQLGRIVFLTGDIASEAAWDFIDPKGLPYVLKPISLPELRRKLQAVIGDWTERERAVEKGVENRRHRRTPMKASVRVRYKKFQTGSPPVFPVINASREGVCFLADREYRVGSDVLVSFPYTGPTDFEQEGFVVRVDDQSEGKKAVAVALGQAGVPQRSSAAFSGAYTDAETPATPEPPGGALRTSAAKAASEDLPALERGPQKSPPTVPLAEEVESSSTAQEVSHRALAKRLSHALTTIEKLTAELAEQKQSIQERENRITELEREAERRKTAATEAEQRLSDLKQAREAARAKEDDRRRLEAELERRDKEIAERNAAIEWLQGELKTMRREAEQREEELAGLRGQLDQATEDLTKPAPPGRKRTPLAQQLEEARQQVSQLRSELAEKETAAAALQQQAAQAEEGAASARRQVEALQQELAQHGEELEALRGEMNQQESEFHAERESAAQEKKQLRMEVRRWQAAAEEAGASLQQARQEMAAARATAGLPEEERREPAPPEQDSARKARQEELRLESQLSALEQFQNERRALERELQRKNTHLGELEKKYERLRAASDQLAGVLREFHTGSINPLTVARVTADLLAGSATLSDSDRENLSEIKRHLDQLLQVLRKLSARLAELS